VKQTETDRVYTSANRVTRNSCKAMNSQSVTDRIMGIVVRMHRHHEN